MEKLLAFKEMQRQHNERIDAEEWNVQLSVLIKFNEMNISIAN